jgi:site-specific DNA-methyltransferase (adenine-specific)
MEYDYIEQGDCLELMKQIPDGSIDMILTDPPYGIKYQSNFRTKSEQFAVLKNDDNDMRFIAYAEFSRILKMNTVCIVFAAWKNVASDIIELQKYFDIKNIVVWWKHGGGLGDLKHSLLTDYELAIICHKGKARIRGKRDGSVWECAKVNPNKMVHPTQKPEELVERLIEKFSDPDNIILDPFLGSGTTAVAAVNTGRHYIGFELDSGYFDIACKRLDEAEGKIAG